MKRIFLFLLLAGCFTMYSSGQQSSMVAVFDKDAPLFVKEGDNSTAVFGLKASAEQMTAISELAAQYPYKYHFNTEAAVEKPFDYKCTITFLHGEGIQYLHKTLLTFGVNYFNYDGKQYEINEMFNVFK